MAHGGSNLHPGGRAAIGLRKLLLTRPSQTNRLIHTPSETGAFQFAFGVVFRSVARTGIGHDHSDLLERNVKRLCDLTAHYEWSLRATVDSQAIVLPMCDGGSGFQRYVSNVRNEVCAFEVVLAGSHALRERALLQECGITAELLRSRRLRFGLEVIGQMLGITSRSFRPLSIDRGYGL